MTQTHEWKITITGRDLAEPVYAEQLIDGDYLIGRNEGNNFRLWQDEMVSGRHARLTIGNSECSITDLKSTNGTFLNGKLIQPRTTYSLKPGDSVKIGYYELAIESANSAKAVIPPPAVKSPPTPRSGKPAASGGVVIAPPSPTPPPPLEKPNKPTGGSVVIAPPPPETPNANDPGVKQANSADKGKSSSTSKDNQVRVPPPTPKTKSNKPQGRLWKPRNEPIPPPIEWGDNIAPPGITLNYSHYLNYLPEIYHNNFMGSFLAMFESIHVPIEWQIDNFDLNLDPRTSPEGFMPWLASWFDVLFDESWTEERKRMLLLEANALFAARGTPAALERLLEIYLGVKPTIDDQIEGKPHSFIVTIPLAETAISVNQKEVLKTLIEANRPAHTTYELIYIAIQG